MSRRIRILENRVEELEYKVDILVKEALRRDAMETIAKHLEQDREMFDVERRDPQIRVEYVADAEDFNKMGFPPHPLHRGKVR